MLTAFLFVPLIASSPPPVPAAMPANTRAAPPLMVAAAAAAAGAAGAAPAAKVHELWRGADGLFYADAIVNGQPVRFLVDTGASTIVLTAADAQRVGAATSASATRLVADTAAGPSAMSAVTLASVTVGPRSASEVRAAVASGGLSVSLLGLTWLAALDSVLIEGDRMVLR